MPRPQPDYDTFRGTRYFASLDGLRCLSILSVIFHHTVAVQFPALADRGFGAVGVDLFFVISGFLITTLLLRERDNTGSIDLKSFYVRRTLRIFPLYYTVLAVYVAVVFATQRNSSIGREFFHNLPFFASYTSNWFVEQGQYRVIFVFAWSLATEEQFYLFWPWIQKFMRGAWAVGLILGLLAVSLIARSGALGSGVAMPFYAVVLANIAPPICLGVLLSHLLHSRKAFEVLARGWTRFNSATFLVLAVAAMATQLALRGYFVDLALLGLVAFCVIAEDHALRPFLTFGVLRKMGIVSYGMYLMHMLSYNAVKAALGKVHVDHPAVAFVVTSAVTFGVASLSFTYYESFFLRLKEKYMLTRRKAGVIGPNRLPSGEAIPAEQVAKTTLEA